MTLKLKHHVIQGITSVLSEMASQKIDDITVSYKISKIAKALEAHNEDIENARQKLIEKFAKKGKDGQYVRPVDSEGNESADSVVLENPEKFQKELIKFLNQEVDVEISTMFTLNELKEANIKLSPVRVGMLDDLIEDQ